MNHQPQLRAKKALVCSYEVPEPDRDRGSHRMMRLLEFLREAGWKTTYIATNGIKKPQYARALQQLGLAVFDGPKTQLAQMLSANQFDLALIAFWPNGEMYLPLLRKVSPRTRVIVDSVDLHYLRDARRVFTDTLEQPASNLLDAVFASQMVGELNVYAAADGVLTVSQKEADYVNDIIWDQDLSYTVPDCDPIKESHVPFQDRKGILSVGSFQHPPNVQAVEFLCKNVIPRLDAALLEQHPVYVVGNGLDDTVCSYGRGLPNVRMVGWVPDLSPYFERSRVSVIPLLYGAGTKGKLLQALLSGTPTVSTSIGVEGLNLRHGDHVLIADDPASFASAITRLLTDEVLWTNLSRQGQAHITLTHGQEAARKCFLQAIAAVMAKKPKRPMLPDLGEALLRERGIHTHYQRVMPGIRAKMRGAVPADATVLVASEGSNEQLRLEGRRAWHFPQAENGEYRGDVAGSAWAITQLETLRAKGATYLLLPKKSLWLLECFPEFKEHLENRYPAVVDEEEVCRIFALDQLMAGRPDEVGFPGAEGQGPFDERNDKRLQSDVRLIAFYLPQFHSIPENDQWWGEGFTEWTNVVQAQPLFPKHYQPHLPADLGFCDLRVPETRQAQAELAQEYGIHGFCYYHYWFNGKMLLERPFNEVLTSGQPDFPFCLCWANEPWSRRWDGRNEDVLQPQTYSREDDAAHIRWLMPALADPRAITVDGKPVLLIYQGKDLPDPAATIDLWRQAVDKAGLSGVYLLTVETGWDTGWDATQVGFDGKVLFQPHFSMLFNSPAEIPIAGRDGLRVFDYSKAWPFLANPDPVSYTRYETVFPSWDNSPRRGENAVALHNSTPEVYESWLRQAIERIGNQPLEQRIVFINAWNEWGEGCHLEPDMKHGLAYLEATKKALAFSSEINSAR